MRAGNSVRTTTYVANENEFMRENLIFNDEELSSRAMSSSERLSADQSTSLEMRNFSKFHVVKNG